MAWKIWKNKYNIRKEKEEKRMCELQEIADNYAKKYVPKRFMRKWIEYIQRQKDEQWKEYRRKLLRDKVKVKEMI